MADYYRDLVAILRARGFVLVRPGKGSHEIWQNPMTSQAGDRAEVDQVAPHC